MSDKHEQLLDHEVRVRLLERIANNIDKRFDKLEAEMKADKIQLLGQMHSNFHWILGTLLAQIGMTVTIFGGIILHMAKLI